MLLDIIEEHLDDVCALFERRQLVLRSLNRTAADLTELDRRLCAHLEGLTLDPAAAWNLCRGLLAEGTVSEGFSAGMIALAAGSGRPVEELEAALAAPSPRLVEGIAWAGGLSPFTGAVELLRRQLGNSQAAARTVAIWALSFRRVDPGEPLDAALASADGALLTAALRAAGQLRLTRAKPRVEHHLESEDSETFRSALQAMVLLDVERGILCCRDALDGPASRAASAVRLLGVLAQVQDVPALIRRSGSGDRSVAREALLALGNVGEPSAVPSMIDALEHPQLGGVAGVALGQILGEDGQGLRVRETRPGRSEEDLDAGVDWTPDDDLPWFSPGAAAEWWKANARDFEVGIRYRWGRPYRPGPPLASRPLPLLEHDALAWALASPGEIPAETRSLRASLPIRSAR